MNTGQLLIGPLGPFDPAEDTHVLDRADGRWLVSERVARGPLRLSDANPSGKVQVWADPDSVFAGRLAVAVGSCELFADGLLVAGLAPGAWLALGPGTGAALLEVLGGMAVGDDPPVLVDRSSGLAAFRLTGEVAPAVLGSQCDAVSAAGGLADSGVLTAPVGGLRATVIRDDVLPEEFGLPGGDDVPLVPSYLVVCDRSVAVALHGRLLEAGAAAGIEPEGFAGYRTYHVDV